MGLGPSFGAVFVSANSWEAAFVGTASFLGEPAESAIAALPNGIDDPRALALRSASRAERARAMTAIGISIAKAVARAKLG